MLSRARKTITRTQKWTASVLCASFITAQTQKEVKELPKRQYEGQSAKPSLVIRNNHIDTSVWDKIELSDNDIFVCTPAKSGTTWMQEIVGQLLYNGDLQGHIGVDSVQKISPWVTMAIIPHEVVSKQLKDQLDDENFKRRILKIHEPVESTPYNPKAKYIVVVREFRDMCWSMYTHHSKFSDLAFEIFNAPRPYPFKPLPKFNFTDGSMTERDFFYKVLDEPTPDDDNPDGGPWWSQLWVAGSWWNVRHLPNVKLVHFQNMKDDLAGTIREIAAFLEIEIDESNFEKIVELCSFKSMKERQVSPIPKESGIFKDESQFLNKGKSGRWKDVLNEEDAEKYRRVARRYLDEDGIRWLETGKMD